MTHADFMQGLTNSVIVRNSNYRISTNDMIVLVNDIYNDIARLITLELETLTVTIVNEQQDYVLPASIGSGQVLTIKDKYGMYLSKYFDITKDKVSIKEDSLESIYSIYDGEDVYITRKIVTPIEALSDELQVAIKPAIVAGIIYEVSENIPSPTASQVPFQASSHLQQVYRAKIEELRNSLPQVSV